MTAGHCRKCGRRDAFCRCPLPCDEVIARVGVFCTLAALVCAWIFFAPGG